MSLSEFFEELPATAARGAAKATATTSATMEPRPPLPHRALERVSPLEGFPQRALDRVLPFDEPLSRISLSRSSLRAPGAGRSSFPHTTLGTKRGSHLPPLRDSTEIHSFE